MNTNFDNIESVYSGKLGCMCGCRGKYHTEGSVVRRIYNAVMNDPARTVDEGAKCVYVDTATRTNVVFFK